jgi:hypothetical protein
MLAFCFYARPQGLEPWSAVLETDILPLNYRRKLHRKKLKALISSVPPQNLATLLHRLGAILHISSFRLIQTNKKSLF